MSQRDREKSPGRIQLVALSDYELSKRLKGFESRFKMTSDEFYGRWQRGETEDLHEFFEWIALCDMAIHRAANRVPA